MKPLITVYIPTFNRLELLKRAILSVQNQTYKNFEVIVVDDNSTDGTREYLLELSNLDQRIHCFFKNENSGACVSRNIAIENAKGHFITGLDDDDYFYSDRLEKFIEYWNNKKNIKSVALYSPNIQGEHDDRFQVHNRILVKPRDLLFGNLVGNQIFAETSLIKEIGGFDVNFPMWQDLDLWYRVAQLGFLERTDRATYFFDTTHLMGRISDNKKNKLKETFELFSKKYNLSKSEVDILSLHLSHYGIKNKNIYLKILKKIHKIILKIRSRLA